MVIATAPREQAADRRSPPREAGSRPLRRRAADVVRHGGRRRGADPRVAGAPHQRALSGGVRAPLRPQAEGPYGLHSALKRRGVQVRVGPLEGLYWTSTDERPLDARDADRSWWRWTLMLALPDEATEGELATALDDARRKRPDRLFDELRVERFVKGPSAQILHVGPLRRGGSDHRTPCRLERGRWLAGVRSPPRDLPRRPAPVATGATAHDPAPAGRACHGAVGSAARRRPTAPLAGLGQAGSRSRMGPDLGVAAARRRRSVKAPMRRIHAAPRSPRGPGRRARRADRAGALADTAGGDQGVQAWERCGDGSDGRCGATHEGAMAMGKRIRARVLR